MEATNFPYKNLAGPFIRRKERKREQDRQRDSGKEGRPAATRGKGGRPEGRRRGGRECTTGQHMPASTKIS